MATENEDFEAREEHIRKFIREQAERAIALRSEDREFHGVEREFHYHQAQMILDFTKTKDVKHPRDVGTAREQILRKFLTSSGYLPKRYGVSDRSIRVASPTGHLSKEIDIALYDPLDSLSLMNREDVYQVLPIESVFGVIQVKSRLNRVEIGEGLANLASFKKLNRPALAPTPFTITINGTRRKSDRGFAILFGFDSDLSWANIISEIKTFADANPARGWTNAVFILNRGFILHGREGGSEIYNDSLEHIQSLQMFGYPDRDGMCLYQFQNILLDMLRGTETRPADLGTYFSLPLVAGTHSYSYHLGQFAEVGHCFKHGDYQRKIAEEKLETVIDWCRTTSPINWVRSIHLAYDLPEDEEAYKRQPGEVYIYNPDGLELRDILTVPGTIHGELVKSIGYDTIRTNNMQILIPYYYSAKEGIISMCPQCRRTTGPKRTNRGGPRKAREK